MCYFCDNRERCRYHERVPTVQSELKFTTGMRYSSTYKILDLVNGEITERQFRSERERDAAPVIEVDQKEATCTKCGYFSTTTNYFVKSKTGTASVNICEKCLMVQFANTRELLSYVREKLKQRYHGSDPRILYMLAS